MKNLKKLNELMQNKDSVERELDKLHADDLGLDLPEDYFAKSKNDILEKVAIDKSTKTIASYKSKTFWFAAAGIAVIISLSVSNLIFYRNRIQHPRSFQTPLSKFKTTVLATLIKKWKVIFWLYLYLSMKIILINS